MTVKYFNCLGFLVWFVFSFGVACPIIFGVNWWSIGAFCGGLTFLMSCIFFRLNLSLWIEDYDEDELNAVMVMMREKGFHFSDEDKDVL